MFKSLRTCVRGRARLLLIALLGGGLALGFFLSQLQPQTVTQPSAEAAAVSPQQVAGTLTLLASTQATAVGPEIELPDAKVFLRNPSSGLDVAVAATQLDGKFYLRAPGPGIYLLCWNAEGVSAGCGPKVEVRNEPVFLRTVYVQTEGGLIVGKVLTADGRPCWLNDPFFKLDVSTLISVLDNKLQVVRSGTRANVSGEYAVGTLKPDRYVVRAECEKARAEAKVSVGTTAVQANLTLPNHAPGIEALTAYDNGKGATRAMAGAVVKVLATTRDADKDKIEYLWRTLDGYGAIPATNTPSQEWKLPNQPGLYTLYLMARDGKGGYDFKRFDLQVGVKDIGFSGRVIDETTQGPVTGATVTVNSVGTSSSVSASTNAQGWFNVAVPPAAAPERYVVNINHPQYMLLSRIHDKAGAGNTYELTRAQATMHDPAKVIDVVDTESAGPCGSPGGKDQQRGSVVTHAPPPRKDGRMVAAKAIDTKPCRHRGAHVVLPAGALIDADQKPAQDPVRMAFATLNPARRALPGDYRALDRQKRPVEMLSFGALYAEFRDANGKLLDRLKPGVSAEIRVPVSDEQRPFAKPTIAVWSYNEKDGMWVEEGQAQLRNTPEGWMYVGRTRHFSYLNMDVGGNDPTQATCVRLTLDASLSAWQNLVLRAYVSYNGTSVQVKETALDLDTYHAVYRIPYHQATPTTLRLELRGTFSGQQVVLLNNIINTDARPQMTLSSPPNVNDLWPPYDYSACGVPIVLTADPITLPYYGDINATGRPAFLTGPAGQFLPANGEQVATDYYTAIDPANAKATLGNWWTQNGFGAADGSGGTRAAYMNNNDLGFGRDMNCLKTGNDLACYVTNYGAPDQSAANADDAENRNAAKRGATVTMEYKASEPDATKRVQFFVFGGGVAASPRIKFADLDGLGPKSVPHLCLVCHGGTFDAGSNKAIHARFREFDLPSFKYSLGRSWDFGQSTLMPAELTAFADLNQKARDAAPNPSPIRSLINNWYTGGFGPGTAPVQPAVPAGWVGHEAGYHNVYAKSCRTCHVARDAGAPDNYYTFNLFSDYATTSFRVCGSPKVMPNAYITYKNFWSDASRVLQYKALTGAATCQ